MYQVFTLEQQVQWQDALSIFKKELDVYYRPEYGRVFQEEGMGVAHLFWYEDDTGLVIYPFFLRRINDLPYFQGRLTESYYDITSPYGFAGPVASLSDCKTLSAGFLNSFSEYCNSRNVVTEFVRFHPLLGNHLYHWQDCLKVEKARSVVILNLKKSENEIWASYKYSNRKNISRAKREGLRVVIEENPDHFPGFFEIYTMTMDRCRAQSFYYFSEKFFKNIHELLKGRFVYAHVFKEEVMVSTELLLLSGSYIHSFLGGTRPEYFYCRPNNLLKHEMALWAKRKGRGYFVLGGGYEENDGIFQYKLAFSPSGVKDFYIGKRVHNPKAMQMLEEIRGIQKEKGGGFFPEYRKE